MSQGEERQLLRMKGPEGTRACKAGQVDGGRQKQGDTGIVVTGLESRVWNARSTKLLV